MLYNRIQVNQQQHLYNVKRVHKYEHKLMFRQHWQIMLNKYCLNGPVPTGRSFFRNTSGLILAPSTSSEIKFYSGAVLSSL